MTAPSFSVGDSFVFDGHSYRVAQGGKGPTDQLLEVKTERGWRPVGMSTSAMMADFFFQNEERLYPRPAGEGGWKYVRFMNKAISHGWKVADDELKRERIRRDERRRRENAA